MSAFPAATRRSAWLSAAVVVGIVSAVAAALLVGSTFGQMVFMGAAALALGVCALGSPLFATVLLLVTMFVALPLRSIAHLPIDPIKLVFAVLIVSTALWIDRTPTRLPITGAVEWAMALYVIWNIYSMFAPHKYTAGSQMQAGQLTAQHPSVLTFVFRAALIPFVLYVVGRHTFDRAGAVRAALWTILAVAAYSAVMSILPFTGPSEWVWPRYIVDTPTWPGRAVGVFNQPVVNGMVLVLGFAIAMLLASSRSESTWRRLLAFAVAATCGWGIYFTYTRAVWLSAVVVLIIGAILAKRLRTGFIAVLCLLTTTIVVNWSVFTSPDREAGGVASPDQVEARLNIDQTALWAAAQKPLTGWGIGRFEAVNTYHHQQWSLDIPWRSGFGDAAHENELGILAELGLIGLMPWICALALIIYLLWNAYRTLPDDDLCGKPLAVISIMAIAILLCTGLTVDLRFFDFPTAAIFLLAGITIGWADRHERSQGAAGGDVGERERVPARHV